MLARHVACATLAVLGCGRLGFDGEHARDAPDPIDAARDTTIDAPPSYDYCSEIPPLAAPPVIDGVLEPGLATTPMAQLGWTGSGSVPATNSASYAVAWRPDGVYFFVAVTDPDRYPAPQGDDIFCGEAVEAYVDYDGLYPDAPGYGYPGTAQFIAQGPANATDDVAIGQIWNSVGSANSVELGAWSTSSFGAFPTPTGYVVEAFITASDLGLASWAPAGQVGLDVAIDVSTPDGSLGPDNGCDTSGTRLGQYFEHTTAPTAVCQTGGPFCDVLAFCTASL